MITGRKDITVIPPGGDHLLSVDIGQATIEARLPFSRYFLTFGHHSNKRPELAIAALTHDQMQGGKKCVGLVVLGVKDEDSGRLAREVEQYGLKERVVFFRFVSQSDYRWLVEHAEAICLLSTDEGYGIPVAEAMSLGRPVIASEAAAHSFSGSGYVRIVRHNSFEISTTMASILDLPNKDSKRADGPLWSTSVYRIRSALLA